MKSISLILLLSLVGCGNVVEPQADGSQTPDVVDATAKIMANDEPVTFNRIMAVCNALRAKEDYIRESARTQKVFTLDVAQQDCRGVQTENLGVSSRINSRSGSYKFEYTSLPGMFLPIPAVESRNDGLLEEICDKGTSMISPMPISDTDANVMIYTAFDNQDGCASDDSTKTCLYIARGNYSADKKTINVTEKHLIEFKLTGVEKGFYSMRRLSKTCINSSNKNIYVQVLK